DMIRQHLLDHISRWEELLFTCMPEHSFRRIRDFRGWHVIGYQPVTVQTARRITIKTGLGFRITLPDAPIREHWIFQIYPTFGNKFQEIFARVRTLAEIVSRISNNWH
ncbi:MAG: hypothetical protein NTV68_14880, partial [Methanomicrobiales archaeon]|nr:hypothetical protein [Methanomicrobiales archaeon]